MDENKVVKGLAYCGVFVFMLAVCWYLLAEPDVSDQRERADSVGAALERADEIASGIDEAESRIEASQERRGECAEILEDSERRIEESRAIIQAVRSRAGQDGK